MEILIRSAEPKDYLDVQEIHAMPEVYSGTLQLPLPSEELWKKRLSGHPESIHLFVAEADGKVIGFSGLDTQQKARRKHVAGIWICVHDHWHNKGIATQLLSKVIDIAKNWLGITRIELTVFDDNEAAIKLYERAGFVKEGVHKNYALRNGKLQDVYAMARVSGT